MEIKTFYVPFASDQKNTLSTYYAPGTVRSMKNLNSFVGFTYNCILETNWSTEHLHSLLMIS